MNKKRLLRWIALAMALAAAVFVAAALGHPEWGTTLEIGGLRIGAPVWRACYALYLAAMCGLLGASFFIKEKGR